MRSISFEKYFRMLACLRPPKADRQAGYTIRKCVHTPVKCGAAVIALIFIVAADSYATITNGTADIVLGQSTTTNNSPNTITSGRFYEPGAIALEGLSAPVYVADSKNNRILVWSNAWGLINGQAADNVIGQVDFTQGKANRGGAAAANTLNNPCGLAVDSTHLWVADCGNNRVLRFTISPSISGSADLVLGQSDMNSGSANRGGTVAANTLYNPTDVVRNEDNGDIWVADAGNNRVLRFSFSSLATGMNADLVLGQSNFTSRDPGSGQARLYSHSDSDPGSFGLGVAISNYFSTGDVWVADTYHNRVLKFTPPLSNGMSASLVLGQADFISTNYNRGGSLAANTLGQPAKVAIGNSNTLWVTDTYNSRMLRFDSPSTNGPDANLVLGQTNFTSWGPSPSASGLSNPQDIYLMDVDVWVADTRSNRVLKFSNPTANGASANLALGQQSFDTWRPNSIEATGLYFPYGVAVDKNRGRVFVADYQNNRVLWWNQIASLLTGESADGVLGQTDFHGARPNQGGTPAANTLLWPSAVAVDPDGNPWVADTNNNRMLRYDETTLATGSSADLVLGQADFNSNQANRGGSVASNTLASPRGVSIDVSGNVWVSDGQNHRLLKFNAGTVVNGIGANLVLGQADFTSNSSNRAGPVAANTLYDPRGIYAENGNVWVADAVNNRILKYASPSINGADAILVLGQTSFLQNLGGIQANKFSWPTGVAVDNAGNVWTAEQGNNRVMKFAPPLSTGMSAVQVLGQGDFISGNPNRGGAVAGNTLWPDPYGGVATDNLLNVYVGDTRNNRVVVYNSGFSATALNPAFTIRTDASLTASWTAVSGANYVAVLASDSNYSSIVASVTQSGTSKTFTTLSSLTTYYFQVKLSTETDVAFSLNRISTATLAPSPGISAITPSSGTVGTSVNVTNLAGTGFQTGTAVKLTRTGQSDIAAINVAFVNSTKLTCTLPLTGAATGLWNMVVTNPDAQSGQLSNGFTIKAVPPAPTAVTPNTGANNGSINITNLAGSGFQAGAAVALTRAGEFDVTAAAVNVVSTVKITCTLPLTDKTTGPWNIVVTNPDGQSAVLANGFTITYPPPAVSAITPASGINNASVDVTNLAGTYFQAGAAVKLTKAGQTDIAATGVAVAGSTKITCALPISGASTGTWNVVVTNPDSQSGTLPNGFLVVTDTTPPAGLPSTPSAGALYSTSGDVTFTWAQNTASDPESGISGYDLQAGTNASVDDASIFSGDVANTLSKAFTGLAEGACYARVRAKNGYNLPGGYTAWSAPFRVDWTPPAPDPPVAGNHQVYVTSITWNAGTAADSNSGLHAQPYSFDNGAAWQAGASSTTAGLQPNSLYNKVIKYRDAAGNVTAGLTVSTYTFAAVPAAFAAGDVSTAAVSFTWDPNGNPSGTAYLAEIAGNSGFTVILGSSQTLNANAAFAGLQPDTVYYSRAKAVNYYGRATAYSTSASSRTLAVSPTGTYIIGVSSGSAALTWSTNGNPSSTLYRTARSLNNIDFDVSFTTRAASATVPALAVETTAYFKVRAENGSGAATDWDTAVSTFVPDYTPPTGNPATPTDEGIFTSSAAITFNWEIGSSVDPESGIAGYYLEAGTNTATNNKSVFDGFSGSALTKQVTALTEGKTYYARVKAKNGRGLYGSYSNWSDGITLDTMPPPAPAVESLTHPVSSITYIAAPLITFNLSAQDASGVIGYYHIIDQSSGTVPDAGSGAYFAGSATEAVVAAGEWFAHFTGLDAAGNIGAGAGHYRFNVGNTITPSADTVFQSGDGTRITIASGTLSSVADILISVPSAVPPEARDSTLRNTGVYREIGLSNPALTLQKSVKVSIPYSHPQIAPADEEALKLSHYNGTLTRWEVLYDSVVDKINNTVTAPVTHFSPFKIIVHSPQSAELANTGNYPNPFTAGQGGTTKIHYSLKANRGVEIYIYDLLGRLVWRRSLLSGAVGGSIGVNDVPWDGKNDAGSYVGAGAYLCVIKAGAEKKKIKIAVK